MVDAARAVRRWQAPAAPNPGAPPEVPPGWQVGPPDFVGIGVQGAGSRGLFHLIARHPAVHRAAGVPIALHYFDRFWRKGFAEPDATGYAAFFPRPPGGFAGEWTPSYIGDFWTPELIARAAPDAKVLVLLRDPVERFVESARRGSAPPTLRSHREADGAFQRGLYAQQLRRVFDSIARERVLLLQHEAVRADRASALERTLAFIGLTPAAIGPMALESDEQRTHPTTPGIGPAWRASLVDAYAPDIEVLHALAPELDLALWPSAVEAGLG